MATKIQKAKWALHIQKATLLTANGMRKGSIKKYNTNFIEKLRHYSYSGVSASVLLLCRSLCNGHCYDRALLATLGLENNFKLVYADIDSITLSPEMIDLVSSWKKEDRDHYGNHCFVEYQDENGQTWVYDTSKGLVFDKDLYYKIENPKITLIRTQEEIENFYEYQKIKAASFDDDKYALPLIMPNIESIAENEINPLYKNDLQREIELFKTQIDYERLLDELTEEMSKTPFAKKGVSNGH